MSKPLASGQDSPLNNNKKMKNLNFKFFFEYSHSCFCYLKEETRPLDHLAKFKKKGW